MEMQADRSLGVLRRSLFFVSLPFFILNLMLPVYGREIGASVVEIGLFFTAFSIMTVLLRPLVGWGIDRFGRRGFLLAGLLGYVVTMFSFAFIDRTAGVLVARVIQGISSALLWLSVSAIVADLAGEQARGVAFGRVIQSNTQGAIVGTAVGFTLLNWPLDLNLGGREVTNWMLLFLVYSVVSLYALWIAARGLPETRPVATPAAARSPIRWSRTWVLLLVVALVTGAAAAMLAPILIIFLQDRLAVGIESLSWAFLPSALVGAFLPARLGRLADRYGRKPMMLVGLSAAAVTSFVIPALGSVLALGALWAFQSACYAAGDPAEQALVADLTGKDQRGRGYGLYVMCADLGAAVGPLGGAWLYQTYGPAAPFYANGVVLAACALALLAFLKVPRVAAQAASPD
jgi:MFS family permease